jgi:hypothetical protein
MSSSIVWAYDFDCDERGAEVLVRQLNELGPWKWAVGESVCYGSYLKCRPVEGVSVRLIDSSEPSETKGWGVEKSPRCNLSVEMVGGVEASRDQLDATVRQLLSGLGARNITETAPW